MTILDRIIEQKRIEVAQHKAAVLERDLMQNTSFNRQPISASETIRSANSTGIIAEFKRKSPSKGTINGTATVTAVTQGYVLAGAACLSVLTDEPFFGGTSVDLIEARQANPGTPILRKDFVISAYQLIEAKAWGADLVLLIASCLSPSEIVDLSHQAHDLGMEVLLEIHDEDELDRSLCDTVDLVGVNNRNLKTFVTSTDTSLRLIEHIPPQFVKITESGLHDANTMRTLSNAGYDGFLIGEAFMKTQSPGEALTNLVAEYTRTNALSNVSTS